MRKFLSISIVTIIAFSAVSMNADQLFKTQLKIYVIDDLGNLVENAEVRLFGNEKDYKAEKNQVGKTLKTDAKGEVKFDQLEPKVYFLLVEKGDTNNWNGAVQTDKLQAKKVNKIRIVIE